MAQSLAVNNNLMSATSVSSISALADDSSCSSFNSSHDLNELKIQNVSEKKNTKLNDSWTLWAHLPHDTDWTINSYKPIMSFSSVEDAIALIETIPNKMIKNCMLFLMRKGIQPVWEDVKNRKGGCFSYKVNNKNVCDAWKNLSYSLIGETLTENMGLLDNINGITISPKKTFCIVKIWTAVCDYHDPNIIIKIPELTTNGCIFKKHNPEY
jgi:hypothetical protein